MAKTKVPEPRQLPSGKWHIRMHIDGHTIYVTEPTREAAISEAMAIKSGLKAAAQAPGREKTLTQAIDAYIGSRQNVLSPATIRDYRSIQRNRFQGVMHTKIGMITPQRWQSVVNAEARRCSAKTLKNAWSFMATVIHEATGQLVAVKLPQVIPHDREFLDPDQIKVFLVAVHGDSVEIAALLALSSLRQSEILALDWADVDLPGGVIHVRSSSVPDENHKRVKKKEMKNASSRRDIPIIAPLRECLEAVQVKSGPLVPISSSCMYNHIKRICVENGLPPCGPHSLRHSFASLAYELQIPEMVAMKIGGWSDVGTMRKIYTHISEKRMENSRSAFISFFEKSDENGDKK